MQQGLSASTIDERELERRIGFVFATVARGLKEESLKSQNAREKGGAEPPADPEWREREGETTR